MARFNGGWIKLWRKTIDGDLPGNVYLWALWHWLLLAATWKPSKILWNGKQREIPAGTVVFGLKELALKWECSRSVLSKWLQYLHDTKRIVYETSTRGCVVTICNWEIYQSKEGDTIAEREHGVNTATTPREHGETLNEEVQEGKKGRIHASGLEIQGCIEAWGGTLKRYGIQKDPRFDETQILRLVQRHGVEKARLALLGAGFESKSEQYDPAKHCRITRLDKPDIFEKLVNLGAQQKSATRETAPVEVPC